MSGRRLDAVVTVAHVAVDDDDDDDDDNDDGDDEDTLVTGGWDGIAALAIIDSRTALTGIGC